MIYTLIRYPGKVIIEAVVLVMEPALMRVAAAGFSDVLEFRRSNGWWFAESGEKVELEFLLASAPAVQSVDSPTRVLRVRAAGSGAI